ncbi:MAG: hypothetical protein U1F17_08335 [Burkholderiaceae bacterium]
MLSVLSVSLGGDAAGVLRATRSMERQGMAPAVRQAWQGGELQAWSQPAQGDTADCFVRTPDGAACCVGPIWYRGAYGVAALRRLLDEAGEADPLPSIDETKLRGNFALFLQKGARAWLLNDALGFARLYGSRDGRFHSTSWLAARAYTGDAEIDEAAAIEYVLLGAPHSEQTVARSVTKLAIGHAIDLGERRAISRFAMGIWSGAQAFVSFGAAASALEAHLRTVFAEIVSAFPGRTSAALSGGFDSRLIVAGLLAQGERPTLFVYGKPDSEDVPIANEVARAEGIPIRTVDKDAVNRELPEAGLEELVRCALFFDGLSNDGIDDRGADRNTRIEQSAAGMLALNGGGGEIFRNFFHLPDRRFRARDIVRAFYRGFDPGVLRRRDGLAAYEAGMIASIGRSVGLGGGEIGNLFAREQTELVYPLFRCHHWMGLNNSIALRHGQFATPLVDLQTVRAACMLPLAWKNAGLFESRLITSLHRGIASRPSAYGFRFSDGPNLRARWTEWSTGMRPVFARPLINAARRRLRKLRASDETIARYRRLLPGEWRLDGVLDLTRLPDDASLARAMSVELVSRELKP